MAPLVYAKVQQNLIPPGSQDPTLRMGKVKVEPVVNDNRNFIINAPFSIHELKVPLRVSFLPCASRPDRVSDKLHEF